MGLRFTKPFPRNYDDFLKRSEARWGSKFNTGSLNEKFIPYYNSGERITVQFCGEHGEVYSTKRGRIGVTTGWKPCFILLLTTRSLGSSWTIGPHDKVVA